MASLWISLTYQNDTTFLSHSRAAVLRSAVAAVILDVPIHPDVSVSDQASKSLNKLADADLANEPLRGGIFG